MCQIIYHQYKVIYPTLPTLDFYRWWWMCICTIVWSHPSIRIWWAVPVSLWKPTTVNSMFSGFSIPHRCYIHFWSFKFGLSTPITPDLFSFSIIFLSLNPTAFFSQSIASKSFFVTNLGISRGRLALFSLFFWSARHHNK